MRIFRCAVVFTFLIALFASPATAQLRSRKTFSPGFNPRNTIPAIGSSINDGGIVKMAIQDDNTLAPRIVTPDAAAAIAVPPSNYRGLPPIKPIGISRTLQDDSVQPIAQDDVPNPPRTGEGNQQIGPPLQVQSNAATMPDEFYKRSRCNIGCPKSLFRPTRNGTQIGGWLSLGYYTDDNGLFNSFDDRTRAQQAWVFAERKARRCCKIDIGYRVDGFYGTDAQFVQAIGNNPVGAPQDWDNSWDNGIYGWALPQAYAEFAYNKLSVRAGKFFSPLGYESIAAPDNFFYSHTFSRFYLNPFTHTGALAVYDASDRTQLYFGGSLGWDTGFDQVGNAANYLGGIRIQPDCCSALSYFVSGGDTGFRGDGWSHNLVAERKMNKNISSALELNYQDLGNAQEFSWANYSVYKYNDCLSLGSRFEWYKSDRFTGTDNSTYSFTTALNFRRNANIVTRPELRVDWGAGAVDPGQVIAGYDVIITF